MHCKLRGKLLQMLIERLHHPVQPDTSRGHQRRTKTHSPGVQNCALLRTAGRGFTALPPTPPVPARLVNAANEAAG